MKKETLFTLFNILLIVLVGFACSVGLVNYKMNQSLLEDNDSGVVETECICPLCPEAVLDNDSIIVPSGTNISYDNDGNIIVEEQENETMVFHSDWNTTNREIIYNNGRGFELR